MSVNLSENEMMERYDIIMPFKLGRMKDAMDVGHWDKKKGTITLTKELSIQDIQEILNTVDDHRTPIDDRPPPAFNETKKEAHFELTPDE